MLPFPWSFPPRPGGGVGGCFGTRAGSGRRTDEVEDVDLALGAALGPGGYFGAGFAFAFAFAEAADMGFCHVRPPPRTLVLTLL